MAEVFRENSSISGYEDPCPKCGSSLDALFVKDASCDENVYIGFACTKCTYMMVVTEAIECPK